MAFSLLISKLHYGFYGPFVYNISGIFTTRVLRQNVCTCTDRAHGRMANMLTDAAACDGAFRELAYRATWTQTWRLT